MDRSVVGFTSIAHMVEEVKPAARWVGDGVLKGCVI
jgi:hypothetical protein